MFENIREVSPESRQPDKRQAAAVEYWEQMEMGPMAHIQRQTVTDLGPSSSPRR